ncbi:ABC transporter permease [Siccirubricoccus phaeus]|uniref:ABC transporter permease n=1 Tax=Siccirubricoccus phaeus TaxID=2595053 RepID=UPI0011F29836|nr:ABC transporter permease subunit [Siccirubricoccus phaeus]
MRGALASLGAVAALVALWEAAVRFIPISPNLLAPPSAIAEALALHPALLLEHGWATAHEALLGFLLAALAGMALGAALSASALLRQALMPFVLALQIVPKMALAPLFVVWLGVGAPCRMAFAIFIAFFPVLIGTMAGLAGTESGALRLCRVLGASWWQTLWRVRLPYAVPQLLAGLKTAATMALLGVVIGEFVTAQQGLGYVVMFGASLGETALVLAAITLLCAIGLVLYGVVLAAELAFGLWYKAPLPAGEFA